MIRVEHISKSFGPQTVLRDVSISIEDNRITTIVGPSGVGKSVLLKLIMGILAPDAGRIHIGPLEITAAASEYEKNQIRSQLGVLFQSAALFDSLTVYENVAFALRARKADCSKSEQHERVCNMLSALSLTKVAFCFPEEISIGVRKRVGLARALITEPQVVLFDEPNTGLDPLVGQEVYDLIAETKECFGFTGVVISHELPEVFQVSDKVCMLLGGRLVFEGTPSEMEACSDPAVQQFLSGSIDGPIKIH